MTRTPRILIAAGGTGGHIFPAIALGEALARHYPEVRCDFLCGERELERRLYAANGIVPTVFPVRQLGRGLVGRISGILAAAGNTLRAARLIRRNRYDVVVGMGGYVCGPAVLGARLLRRATALHEANSIPGKTNTALAPYVDFCAVHFPCTAASLKARRTIALGMPIRESVTGGSREEAVRLFDLDPDRRTLLILGGSQGAKYLYDTLMKDLPLLDVPELADSQILWSTGTGNYDELAARLRERPMRHLAVKLMPFIDRMDHALAVADVAVARAGASTIAELLACGVYALYVPFPSAIYDHQTLNAREVEKVGAGELIPEKELTPERAAERMKMLLERARSGRLTPPDVLDSREAARRLADEVMALVRRKA